MVQLVVFLFIGLSLVYPGCGQFEFPNDDDEVQFIIGDSAELDNTNDDVSNLQQHSNPIIDMLLNQLLNSLFSIVDDEKCSQDMKYAFRSPLANDQAGLKMLDAFGKPQSGILEGNVRWVGNYHECINVYVPLNYTGNVTVGDFNGQYCQLDMSFEAYGKPISISLGVCLPESCGPVPVERFKGSRLSPNFNITKKTCQPRAKSLTSAATAMICMLSLFLALALVGSSITVYEYFAQMNTREKYNGEISENMQIQDSSPSAAAKPKKTGWYETVKEFFTCFCVFSNGGKLLDTSGTEGQLLCIHGIRFLSMTWVILCHAYSPYLLNLSNFVETAMTTDTWLFQIVLNGYFSVDAFFLLSGFLLAHLYFKEAQKTNGKTPWLYFYIHRYVRLTPVYMMVLGYYTALTYYMGSGPSWQDSAVDPICEKNWFYNILYINNLISHSKLCMPWTWYLANDMQFFVISPLILITLWRRPKVGYAVLGLLMSITVCLNLGISIHNNLQTGYGTLSDDPTSVLNINIMQILADVNHYYELIYEKPYTRIGPYLIGIALAYYLFKRKQDNAGKLNLITLVCGWIISSALALTFLFCVYHRKLSVVESGFYNAFSHVFFAAGLGWVIFTCLNNQAGPVDSILSFKLFIPLSRLTYCAYLIHPLILNSYYGALKTTFYFSHFTVVTLFLGLLVITYAFSFAVSVLFESPIIRLDKFVRTKLTS